MVLRQLSLSAISRGHESCGSRPGVTSRKDLVNRIAESKAWIGGKASR